MNLPILVDKLTERLKLPLPGSVAHEPMRARPAVRFHHQLPPKPGSVLILLYEDEGKIKFPLTKRPDYLGVHGGQISLPGGKRENDENEIQNALRETQEEIGVPSTEIKVIGRLSDFFVIPSNYIITPVVGYHSSKPKFIPQESEVVKIINGDLNELIKDNAVQEKEILAAKNFPMTAPYFSIENETVWGATAMMLNEFRMIVREMF